MAYLDEVGSIFNTEEVDSCPACGGHGISREIVNVRDWEFHISNDFWHYVQCEHCQSIYLKIRPTPETIGNAYSSYYTHSGNIAYQSLFRSTIVRIKSLLRRLSESPSGRIGKLVLRGVVRFGLFPRRIMDDIENIESGVVLDIGCGSGAFLESLSSELWEKVGVDFDPRAVHEAREKGLEVHLGGVEDIRGLNRRFNLIVCGHVLEHVYSPLELIDDAISLLEDEGQLWMQWPNPKADGLLEFQKYWRGLEAPRHLVLISSCFFKSYISNFHKNVFIRDVSFNWKSTAIYMRRSSKLAQIKDEVDVRFSGRVLQSIRYALDCGKIVEPEMVTVVLTKKGCGVSCQ